MIINKREKKKNYKRIIKIVIPILIIILLLIFISRNVKNVQKKELIEKVKNYTSVDDFKTIEEVALYMDCEYVKEETSKTEGYETDIYLKIKLKPYSDGKSNKNYYETLMLYCAKVLQYNNFIIIDQNNELVIAVICNKENFTITNYNINGNNNYFETLESQKAVEDFIDIKELDFTITSEEVLKLVENNWNVEDSVFGNRDSIFRDYQIYFEEGISVRKIDGKVFNVVLNNRYTKEIFEGITTSTSQQEIVERLGTPHFKNNEIIGYKTEEVYIFFHNNEVSIYNTNQINDTHKFAKLVEEYTVDKDLIKFTTNLKNIWPNYDVYKYDSDYVILQYSTMGVSIKYNYNLENGIYIYSNYNGYLNTNITYDQVISKEKETPYNIFLKNENLVFVAEQERIVNQKTIKYDTQGKIKNFSNKFIIDITNKENGIYEISFISKTGESPNRELKEYINYGIWFDDDNFIYSVSGKGIYMYNAKTNKYTTIYNGNEKFEIKKLENKILEYDEKSITIE